MLKNKSAILLLVMAIVCLLSGTVFAAEVEAGKYYTADDVDPVLKEDVTHTYAAVRVEETNLTITGGNIKGLPSTEGYSMAVWARNAGASVTILDGNFTNEPDLVNDPDHVDLIYASGGANIVIEGGTFKCATPQWTLNCKNNSNSSITVKGGKFFNYDPRVAPDKASEGEVIVADGYTVVGPDADGWYEVKKVETSKVYKGVTETITLDGTISENGCWGAIQAWDNANLTINGNGNVHGESCDGRVVGRDGCPKCGASTTVAAYNGSIITINGGNYTNEPDKVSKDDREHVDLIYVKNGGKIIINGGTFKCATPGWTLNANNTYTGQIIVRGGRFFDFNPLTANETEGFRDGDGLGSDNDEVVVEEGYSVFGPDADGWYEVCKHNLKTVEAKAATNTTEGNHEYYTCDVCNNMFKDSEGTKLTNKAEVTIAKLIIVENNNATVDKVVVDTAVAESGNSSVVELPAVENATSVTVPVESVKAVENADKGLTVATKDTTVTLDAKAVEEVAKQAGTATKITIEVTKTEEKTLNKEQKEAIKDKEVAIVLSAKILADGNEISNFNGGKVKVEIPFTPAEGTKGSDYKVYYVADDGKVEAIPTRYVKEKLVVELEHFSEYVVVKEVATAAPAPSAPAASANPNEKDNTPKTGAVSVIGLVVAMSVIGLAVLRKRD